MRYAICESEPNTTRREDSPLTCTKLNSLIPKWCTLERYPEFSVRRIGRARRMGERHVYKREYPNERCRQYPVID